MNQQPWQPWVILAFFGALGAALVGGVFFAFSTFVMGALARLPVPQGIAAMQSINITVINPAFMGAFLGNALICIALMVGARQRWQGASVRLLFVGCLLYLIGVVLVTLVFHVPRNDALAAVDPSSPEAGQLWTRYRSEWTAGNHVRTAASLVAAALLAAAGALALAPRGPQS